MSQIETLKALTQRENEQRLERLAFQIESVRQAKHQSAEELAATLEPLAQAMAALADETRQTLAAIQSEAKAYSDQLHRQSSEAAKLCQDAASEALKATHSLNRAGQRMEWRHYGLAVLTGLTTAALVTAFWLWLAPPKIWNILNPQEVAEWLKPALIGQPPPSSGRPRH